MILGLELARTHAEEPHDLRVSVAFYHYLAHYYWPKPQRLGFDVHIERLEEKAKPSSKG